MTARLAAFAIACAVLVGGCTASPTRSPDTTPLPDGPTAPDQAASSPSSPTPPAAPSTDVSDEVVLGTGTLTVDGTELRVSGDCDISREFGAQPVRALGDDVDVLLTVDNLTGDGGHDGPFAIQVRLRGRGELVGRSLVSEGAPGEGPGDTVATTYEGEIEVAELRDRRELEFLDVATLHLEAGQQRTGGDEGPRRRRLTLDVSCPISGPAG